MTSHRLPLLIPMTLLALACEAPFDDPAFREYPGGSDSGEPSCESPVLDVDPRRSLIETSEAALAGFTMNSVLEAIAVNGGVTPDAGGLYQRLMDTYNNTASAAGPGPHCDDTLTPTGQPGIGDFPLQCPRAEGAKASNDSIDQWFAISAVNRFDLAKPDASTCGEARITLANPNGGRMFVIFEAEIPNPDPSCGLDACAPVQQMWASLSTMDDPAQRGLALRRAFLGTDGGDPVLQAAGFEPFVRLQAFGPGTGQIRTNNFNQGPWTLREFETSIEDPEGTPTVGVSPVPVTASPFGPLWGNDPSVPHRTQCQADFVAMVGGLMTDDPNAMVVDVSAECFDAESAQTLSDSFAAMLSGNPTLSAQIEAEIDSIDPTSSLGAVDIANRAQFAGSCIGCHQTTNGIDLGDGVTAPPSLGFVHVSEQSRQSCDGSLDCFRISSALQGTFLPRREQVMEQFLASAGCCEPSPPPSLPSDCCEAHPGTGCDEPSCEAAVCGLDAYCCGGEWDAACADLAVMSCEALCGGEEPPPPPPPSNCCEAHPGTGCDEPSCEAAVCGLDAYCCGGEWDAPCADLAAFVCGEICP